VGAGHVWSLGDQVTVGSVAVPPSGAQAVDGSWSMKEAVWAGVFTQSLKATSALLVGEPEHAPADFQKSSWYDVGQDAGPQLQGVHCAGGTTRLLPPEARTASPDGQGFTLGASTK